MAGSKRDLIGLVEALMNSTAVCRCFAEAVFSPRQFKRHCFCEAVAHGTGNAELFWANLEYLTTVLAMTYST